MSEKPRIIAKDRAGTAVIGGVGLKNALAIPADQSGEDRQRSFASAKFDLLDCISMDPRVTHSEFRVAFRLTQHANGETGAIFPSQERLADQTGMKVRTVRACIAGLIRKGWLHVFRPNRRTPNLYRFDSRHINAILDRQLTMDDARKEERMSRSVRVERHPDDGQTKLTGITQPLVSGIQMTPNTLTEHLKNSLGTEEGDYSLPAAPQTKKPNRYALAKGRVAS
jgi:hypothetical protein